MDNKWHIQETWQKCREDFGDNNASVVSNSVEHGYAGACILCFSVSLPILNSVWIRVSVFPSVRCFSSGTLPKPSYLYIAAIQQYCQSLSTPMKDEQPVVVRDHMFADAN